MNESLEILEVKTLRDLKKFVRFPFRLYKSSPFWIPPLISGELDTLRKDRNPAFEHCEAVYYLAVKNNSIAGRIAGIINNRFIERWEKKWARFCWFDFIDDEEVSKQLLRSVETWARNKGMDGITGPMGFSTFERQGIVVKGFDDLPTFSSVYNYPYYPEHLEKHGYAKQVDYVEYLVKVPSEVPEKAVKLRNLILERYRLRTLEVKTKKEMLQYGRPVFEVINAAYRPLFGFIPLTEKQIDYYLKKYGPFLFPDYVTAVLDENDRLVGFQVSIPSLSRAFRKARGHLYPFGFRHFVRAFRNPEKIDIMLVAVHPDYQNKGVNSVFMTDLTSICIRKGIKYAESNGELEENQRVQNFWRYYDANQYKRNRVYFKSLV